MFPTLATMKKSLLCNAYECSLRCLTQNMKWSSELASVLLVEEPLDCSFMFTENQVLLTEYDKYLYGKACFECKEFSRAANHLKSCTSQPAIFLYYYSRYMEFEKQKRYKMVDVLDEKSVDEDDFEDLVLLKNDLKKHEDSLDAFGFYLNGVVLKRISLFKEASESFECAVQMQPMLWCAWQELADLCEDRQILKDLKLPKHWMCEFFYAYAEMELHMNEEALSRYQKISLEGFENSTYIKSQIATALYNLRDFEASVEHFKCLQTMDPYMLDHIDTYSNILYIHDDRVELSYLAHRACEVDKYRAETCGVVGNYYSLRGDHDKAVLYFKQSLRLNPEYVAAWTLLGHEYIELKNTSAAIEAYRHATDVNCRDYRAWYGLGQAYELLKLSKHSLYYFREAQRLRPNDTRMLIALGDTYQNIEKQSNARKCYLKAVRLGDSEGQATIKLAKLHESSGQNIEAAKLYSLYIDKMDNHVNATTADASHACIFVARYHLRAGRYEDASTYARKAVDYPESREIAKTLLFEISKISRSHEI
ncbi:cell division cycle protein 23 homolog [Hydra vulgaris]|uniref:Cell division cycle protein 23 homolog n=1 Tax=Hydra vulgaris TaxID=6087 RepID=A0ABM4BWE5_HYDVU